MTLQGSEVRLMKCERCPEGEEARYRAYSDIIDMKVCARCAADGRRLGLGIEVLDPVRSSVPQAQWPRRRLRRLVA
jgi:hypothetical protein